MRVKVERVAVLSRTQKVLGSNLFFSNLPDILVVAFPDFLQSVTYLVMSVTVERVAVLSRTQKVLGSNLFFQPAGYPHSGFS
jgi:hypothetical protein